MNNQQQKIQSGTGENDVKLGFQLSLLSKHISYNRAKQK